MWNFNAFCARCIPAIYSPTVAFFLHGRLLNCKKEVITNDKLITLFNEDYVLCSNWVLPLLSTFIYLFNIYLRFQICRHQCLVWLHILILLWSNVSFGYNSFFDYLLDFYKTWLNLIIIYSNLRPKIKNPKW